MLVEELRKAIKGEVRFDNGSRALYATDSSNYRQVPIGIVLPRDEEDIETTIALARKYSAPILARGGGTSLAGQCCNNAVILDFSKYYNRILSVDEVKKQAEIEPGVVLDDLRSAAELHHLTFGPDPATHSRCTLGGMIGNNSCGVHSVYSGKTDDNVEELELLTYRGLRLKVGRTSDDELRAIIQAGGERGKIYAQLKSLRDRYAELIRERYPDIPRRVSGYNLPELLPEKGFHVARALVGSECTCVIVLKAKVRLVYSPPQRALVVVGYPDVYSAGDHLMEILSHKPLALEGIDDRLVQGMRKKNMNSENLALLPEGGGWLFIEFGGETASEAVGHAQDLIEALNSGANPPSAKLFDDPLQAKMVWKVRESGLGATAFVPGEAHNWEGWEDSAVPPEKVGSYLRDFRRLLQKYKYEGCLYGHFGQGCIHTRIDFDLQSEHGIQHYRSFVEEAADVVIRYGGSLSGEHGDGQSRAELLPKMFGPELIEAFREFKSIWDPDGKMNPGKVVNAYRLDENLRLGPSYHPAQPETHFRFSKDAGSFAGAALRCIGVGECRKQHAGIMCPSYMVTKEEKHSTRGRAHLLWEMLQGSVIKDLWRSEEVKEALDLCLACKGCKHECPVEVDMATYKAEFLSHYYKGRLRPASGYALGLIHIWGRLAMIAPRAVNSLLRNWLFAGISKKIAGIAPQRRIPRFAGQTFTSWFKKRERRNETKPKILLWPDTFNNYFHPEVAMAAVEVLESAGFQIVIPSKSLCCGRPLYDFGMLSRAKKLLLEILQTLQPEIRAGIPVVGLEPSCIAVFRDEMLNLFPDNSDARLLAQQTYSLGEFLDKKTSNFQIPRLKGKALVHGHCHDRSVIGFGSEEAVLKSTGLEVKFPDAGCCGMAGAFGFEAGHYDLSLKVGERALLPAVRQEPLETLIVANGFSCREQIEQSTGRKPLHLAELLRSALKS